jgi:putative hydrolases of HD superfamily
MMCLAHDMPEVRSGDHNWIHKRYVKIFEEEIKEDQLGTLPFPELKEIVDEYDRRESKEALLAKEADLLDQLFLLREYVWQGNREAQIWLEGKPGKGGEKDKYLERFTTPSGKAIAKYALEEDPSSWWNETWTNKNR